MDVILFIEFLAIGIVTMCLGFGINYYLKTCKEKKHELFYLVVVISLLGFLYFFLIDSGMLFFLHTSPEIYFSFLVYNLLGFLFLYFIYVWSKFAYLVALAAIVVCSIAFTYELSVIVSYLPPPVYLSLQTDSLWGIAEDSFKLGILLSATYKFLK